MNKWAFLFYCLLFASCLPAQQYLNPSYYNGVHLGGLVEHKTYPTFLFGAPAQGGSTLFGVNAGYSYGGRLTLEMSTGLESFIALDLVEQPDVFFWPRVSLLLFRQKAMLDLPLSIGVGLSAFFNLDPEEEKSFTNLGLSPEILLFKLLNTDKNFYLIPGLSGIYNLREEEFLVEILSSFRFTGWHLTPYLKFGRQIQYYGVRFGFFLGKS